MKPLLCIFLLCALAIRAEVIPADTEAGTDPATATSPDKTCFAATRSVPDDEFVWRTDLDHTRLVVMRLLKDGTLDHPPYAIHTIGGRSVSEMRWSPDSKFLVITTTSSGGHSPYHFKTYVFGVADKSLRYMDDVAGTVLSPKFKIEAPDIAVMTVVDPKHPSIEAKDGKVIKVPLHEAFEKMKKE